MNFASRPIRLESAEGIALHSESRGIWTLTDSVAWNDDIFGQAYQILLSARIDGEEPGVVFMRTCELARDLDLAFNYATGWPLFGKAFSYLLEPQSVPRAWSLVNRDQHIPADDWELLQGITSRPRKRTLPQRPLDSTLRALEALGNAGAMVAELSHLHYGALSTHDPALAPLLLAKGLEAARDVLPGKDLKAKQAALPFFVRQQLPRELGWFYDVSNNRRETRHVIDKSSSGSLKDELTEEERSDFCSGADFLLHYAVVSQLNLPLVLCDTDGVSRVAS